MADRDDDEPKPPEPATPPPRGKPLSAPFEDTGIDWEKEMGAWDAAFPLLDQPPRPGPGDDPDLPEAPPAPDSAELLLDDLAHTPPPLMEQLDDLSDELEIDEELPGPKTPGPLTPELGTPVLEPLPAAAAPADEAAVVAVPGSEPTAPMPRAQESSNVLIIPDLPDVAELEAAATAVPQHLDATPATPVPEPSGPHTQAPAVPRPTGRTLTADGLPDVSELWQPTPTPTAAVEAVGGPFDDELPEEPAVDLHLELPPVSWVWSAAAVAEEVAAGAATGTPPEEDYWKGQLALAVDESAVVQQDEQAAPRSRAQAMLWAARAAERVGRGDALRLYEQVLALGPELPEAAAAVRGQFRLLYAAGALGEARDKLGALAAVAPGEALAYRTLLALARDATPGDAGASPATDDEALEGIPALILGAERAFAAGDRRVAGGHLAALADELGGLSGETLRELAELLTESGPGDRPAALREGAGAYAQEARGLIDLRAASRHQPDEAREQLTAAASALAGTPLAVAVRRWAARLARRHGQPAPLFSFDEGLPGPEAPWPERLERASADAFARDVDELAARFDLVPPAAVPLLARRLAQALPDDRRRDGLALLERAAEHDRAGPGAVSGDVALALAAERLAAAAPGSDHTVALGAWRLVAAHDPARAAVAHHAQAALLLSDPDPTARAAGLQALGAAVAAAPQEASFWGLSWQQRKQGQADPAGESLVTGAAAWEVAGAGRMASAMRDRAAELDAAVRPDALLDRLPARSFPVDVTDDPRALARELLARADDPAALAATWKGAATGGSSLRVAEAAGWLIEAGRPPEALTWLMDAGSNGERSEAVSLYLRRLVRQGDAASQATVLAELLEALPATTPAMERAELEMLRAEALAASGRRREAADLYRELLAGPLAGDADLSMRRVLWALRDGEALESLWRDEHDAQFGAGRVRGAAAALVEKSRVIRDLRGDAAAAAEELRQALEEDPEQPLARVMWLAAMPPSPDGHPRPEVTGLVEALARGLPGSAVSLHFLAALLAEGQGGPHGDAEATRRNLTAAVERAGQLLPITLARRHVAAEQNRTPPDPGLTALLERQAERLAGTPGADVRLAVALLMAAAQLEEADPARAEALYRRVLQLEPDHLPALLRLRRLFQSRGEVGPAADLLAREAGVLRGPHKLGRLHAAAALAFEKMDDPARGRGYLEQALSIEPGDEVAFGWLRASLEQQGDRAAVGELLARRAAVAGPDEAAALRLERVDLLLASGAEAGSARRELQDLLEHDPENVGALRRLAALELGEGNLAAAAALSIRQARYERDPGALVDCFLLIGRLYQNDLQDPKIALGAFERVLRIDPARPEALEALSELYAHQGETRKALAVTDRLVEREVDPRRRRPFLLRLGSLWEAAGDNRRAGVMLRRAVDESPRDLQALGELARFHERQRELPARNVLLDGSLALLREDLRRSPGDLDVLRTMIPVLRWRHRPACAAAAAQLLAAFSTDPAEQAEAAAWAAAPTRARRLAPLASPELDGRALPPGLQGGVRHLLRVLGPLLHRSMRPDLRRWEVGRAQRLPKGGGVRETLEALAGDLGVRGFEAYVSPSQPYALTVEPGEPPSVILGSELVALPAPAIRYACGQMARLMETHFDLLLEQGPMDAATLMAAIVRFFLPDYRPPFGEPGAQAAMDEQVMRALHRAPRAELAPFASEIAGAFTPDSLYADAEEAGARAGLLASGDLAAALQLVAARHGMGRGAGPIPLTSILQIPVAARLVDFALSDDHEELVQALDAVS